MDTVTWCANDIDGHRGELDTEDRVRKVVAVLRKCNIPFLLEASGSPHSYHIWIFLVETKTYNAYRFIRQINSEAEVDCECYPKQKSVHGKAGKFGNLLKLPICRHLKSGNRSMFIDPDTFEPFSGAIQHPGIVHLMEIPELTPKNTNIKPKSNRRVMPGDHLEYLGTGSLNPCMTELLKDDILDDSSGRRKSHEHL